MQHCLVSGASGFVGTVLCQRLSSLGCVVRALVRRQIPGDYPWGESVSGDLSSGPWKPNLFANIDTVFHLAGKAHALAEVSQEEEEYRRINTEGTRKLLQASQEAGVKRFVFFSSVKATGEGGGVLQDEASRLLPETTYGQSKMEAEKLVIKGGYVPHSVVIRPSMIYGPTQKGNLPRMIGAVRKGFFPPLPEVHNKRSMIHVNDVVEAAILAATMQEAAGQTYIVTDGQIYSTRQIYRWICETIGKPEPRVTTPLTLMRLLAITGDMIGKARGKRFLFDSDALEKLIGSAWYSTEKIQNELGYSPKHNLRTTLPGIVRFLDRELARE